MSDLDEIREELDNLRDRVGVLEFHMDHASSAVADAGVAARAADRNVSRSRAEVRDIFKQFEASAAQLTELLTAKLNGPDES